MSTPAYGVRCPRCLRRALSHAADEDAARSAFECAGWQFTEGRDPQERTRMSERALCPACVARMNEMLQAKQARFTKNKEPF